MASRIVQYFSDKLKTKKEYPVTLTKAIYDEDGNRLDNELSDIDTELNNNTNLTTTSKSVVGAVNELNNSLSTLEVSDISVTYNSHCVQDSHIAQAYKTGKIGVISGSVYFSKAGNLSFASVDISPRNNDDHFMLYRTDGGGVRYVDFKNGSFTVTNAEANTWYAFEHTFVI